MKTASILLGSVLALSSLGSAQAMSLSDLMTGGALTVGDKTFDSFTAIYSKTSTSTQADYGFTYNWGNIDVQTINDGGNLGLKFTLNDPLSAGGDNWTDVFFGFHVSAANPNLINGVSLSAEGSYTNDNGNPNSYAIWEYAGSSLTDVINKANLGNSTVNLENGNFSTTNLLSAGLAASSDYFIGKNLIVLSSDAGQLATISSFEQRFNQTTNQVPEPSIVLLLGAGVVGYVLNRRKAIQS